MDERSRAGGKRSDLRERAERALASERGDVPDISPDEVRGLVHELRTHQVELEMQNEELRRAQQELIASRDRYSELYDFAPVGYFTVGSGGLIEEANLTAADMSAVGRQDLIGQPFSRFVAREDQDTYYLLCRRVLETRERIPCELRMARSDGSTFDAGLVCVAVAGGEGDSRRVQVAVTDITSRKQAERERVRLERLHALAEMSAGVSHNLNNILTGVLGPASMLRRMTRDPAMVTEIEEIISAGERARDLVQRLHMSSRGVVEDSLQPVDVNRAVRAAIQTSRSRWKDEPELRGIKVDLVTQLGDVASIRGREPDLHDIIVNLILNALDAMPDGGTVTLTTAEAGSGALLTVKDTGVGMAEETRRRVFEPFFSTKADIGSGLGLSTAHNAVTRWGGEITVESAPGSGATFRVRLPAWKESETGNG